MVWRDVPPLCHSSFLWLGICFISVYYHGAEGQPSSLHWPGRVLLRTPLSSTEAVVSHRSWEENSLHFFFWADPAGFLFMFLFLSADMPLTSPFLKYFSFSILAPPFFFFLSGFVPRFCSQCRWPELHQTDNGDVWIKSATDLLHFAFQFLDHYKISRGSIYSCVADLSPLQKIQP